MKFVLGRKSFIKTISLLFFKNLSAFQKILFLKDSNLENQNSIPSTFNFCIYQCPSVRVSLNPKICVENWDSNTRLSCLEGGNSIPTELEWQWTWRGGLNSTNWREIRKENKAWTKRRKQNERQIYIYLSLSLNLNTEEYWIKRYVAKHIVGANVRRNKVFDDFIN